jgi:ectoine hydroxylase-related dioxygenase (phytanoyl-CoA dioxygenase family)
MVGRASTTQWNVMDDVTPLVCATVRQPASVPDTCINAFDELGVCYLPGAFVDWVDPLRAGLERMMRTPQDFAFPNESAEEAEPGRFFDAYCNWQRVPEFLLYALTSPAAAIAAQCMQSPTAQFFHEHVFAKELGTEKKTPWHHDLPYYCVDGRQTASVYVALDDTDEETAVRFLGGSHRDGNTYTPRRFLSGADYPQEDESMVSAPSDENESPYRVISRSLVAGDAIVFDFRTLHGTTDVRIQSRRRAFSTRWLGEDVRYVERPGITSPPLGDLGVRVGEPMPEHLFPTLWHTPR